jgi:hypothetical protein
MPISIFPAASTSTVNGYSISATTSGVMYVSNIELESAIYSVSCVSSTIATVEFYDNNGATIASTSTVTGSATVYITSDCSSIGAVTNTGSNIVITLSMIAVPLSGVAINGTLDTLTTSGTYTETSTSGYAYVVVVGAGGGAARYNGGGGGSGGINQKRVALTGNISYTIGAGGSGTNNYGGGFQTGGGATSFGNTLTANGGEAGQGEDGQGGGYGSRWFGYGGAGGTPGGSQGGSYYLNGVGSNAGTSSANSSYPFVISGATGSGAGIYNTGTSTSTGGNIGRGGSATNGDATGYGAGAGAGASKSGRPGVIYVLRY